MELNHKCNGCRYKSEHQEMGFRPFGVCTKETNLIEAEKAYKAEVCPYKQNEKTENLNAEQIKRELEGLVNFRTCPDYIKNALALINSQEQEIKELADDLHATAARPAAQLYHTT